MYECRCSCSLIKCVRKDFFLVYWRWCCGFSLRRFGHKHLLNALNVNVMSQKATDIFIQGTKRLVLGDNTLTLEPLSGTQSPEQMFSLSIPASYRYVAQFFRSHHKACWSPQDMWITPRGKDNNPCLYSLVTTNPSCGDLLSNVNHTYQVQGTHCTPRQYTVLIHAMSRICSIFEKLNKTLQSQP